MNSTTFRFRNRVTTRLMAVLMVLCSFAIVSCDDDDDDDNRPTQNIVALVQANNDLSSLEAALLKFPDLVTTLNGNGPFTVFAPTNQAFQNLLTAIGQPNLDAVPEAVLRDILEYHVIASRVRSNQLTTGNVATVGGEDIAVTTTNGIRLNGNTRVTTADVEASNGIVHIIDAVLVPPSVQAGLNNNGPTQNIVQLAQASDNLSILEAALIKFPDLVTTLSGNGAFTVFAPTNTAFEGLLEAIGQTSLDDIPEDVLRDVLEYHVVGSAVRSNQLTNGPVTTVGGEAITVAVGNGVQLNGSANVTTADVEATNGVVHIIDAVLVPPTIQPIVGTIVAPAYFNKNFTTLIAAVRAASPSILTTLLEASDKTLFAPTNEAFTAAGITSLPDQATLDAVLAYHVIPAEVRAADIASGSSTAETLNGNIYLSNSSAGVFINGTTQVTATDIDGSNGVVHVINRVLLPPSETIAEIATRLSTASSGAQFTQLVAALARTQGQPGGDDLLAAVSDASANLTVFAPTDAAFQALYTALGVNGVNDINITTLIAVLKHHVVAGRVFSTDLTSGDVETLNGDVTVNLNDNPPSVTGSSGADNKANLQTDLLNIHATNGVIHVIDRVLIP